MKGCCHRVTRSWFGASTLKIFVWLVSKSVFYVLNEKKIWETESWIAVNYKGAIFLVTMYDVDVFDLQILI